MQASEHRWSELKAPCFSVGIRTFVAVMCASQVLIVIAAFAWTDISIQKSSISTLTQTVERIATRLENRQLEGARKQALSTLQQHLGQIVKCAEHLANHIRDSDTLRVKLAGGLEENQMIPFSVPSHNYLTSLVTYFDVPYAYLGTRESYYIDVERANQADPTERPDFAVTTNYYNGPPSFPGITDTTTLTMQLTLQEEVDFESVRPSVLQYNGRMRPWYNQTRHTGKPIWIKPYLWLPYLVLGSDMCIPIYDHSGLPRIDPNADPDASSEWSESLGAVACCADSLEGLSEILSEFDLGKYGVAFLVEAGGENEGLLIAAAVTGRTRPVARLRDRGQLVDGFDTSSADIERLSAREYPADENELLAIVSREVLHRTQRARAWDEVGEESITFRQEGVGDMGIRTSVLDGSLSGWKVNAAGRWSGSDYAAEGQKWVFVIAQELLREDLDDVQSGLSDLRDQTEWNLLVIGSVSVAVSFLATHLLLRNLSCVLREVCRRMRGFKSQLAFVEERQLSTHLREVEGLLVVFSRMQQSLQILAKYVPPSVLQLGRHVSSGTRKQLEVGELRVVPEACTVMCFSFLRRQNHANLEVGGGGGGQVERLESAAGVETEPEMIFGKVQSAAADFQGELMDFTAKRITVLFTGEDDKGVGHADRACRAAQQLLQGAGTITGCVGISTGKCMLGSYGTEKRMKFGAVGPKLDVARRLCSLAETYNMKALVGEKTVVLASRVFPPTTLSLREEVGSVSVGAEGETTQMRFYCLPNVLNSTQSIRLLRKMTQRGSRKQLGVEVSARPPLVQDADVSVDLVHAAAMSTEATPDQTMHGMVTSEGMGDSGPEKSAQSTTVPATLKRTNILLPGVLVLVLICAFQVLVTLAVLSSTEIPILQRSSKILNTTLHTIVNQTATRILDPLTRESIDVSIRKLNDMPKCAEMIATEMRQKRLSLREETVEWSALFLQSMTIYYDVLYAYYGTRPNRYMEVERRNQAGAGEPPVITMATNMLNSYPDNITQLVDSSLVRFQVDKDGLPLLQTADASYAPQYNPRLRPWYASPRLTRQPTWVKPFVYVPALVLGIDACVPLYDDASPNQIDETAPPDPSSQWNESLAAVLCCDNSLETLSQILSELDLGLSGVVFVVEADGDNAGLMVGAATPGKPLPTSRAKVTGEVKDGFDTSEIEHERLGAAWYPAEEDATIASVAVALLGGREWAEVGEEKASFDLGQGLGTFSCSSKVLDGTVPGWRVGHDGRWSGEEYRLVGMSWRLVVAVKNEDFVQVAPALQDNDEKIQAQYGFATLMVAVLCLASVVLSYLVVRVAAGQLVNLKDQMAKVDAMQLDRFEFSYSFIAEIRHLQSAFEEMREWLERLQRYIPPHVTASLNVCSDEYEECIRYGTLGMTKQPCTVMSVLIPGFLDHLLARNHHSGLTDSAPLHDGPRTLVGSHTANGACGGEGGEGPVVLSGIGEVSVGFVYERNAQSDQGPEDSGGVSERGSGDANGDHEGARLSRDSGGVNDEAAMTSALATMSKWLDCIFAIIVENGGVVVDFEGDTITAFWRGGHEHAAKACLAALKIVSELRSILFQLSQSNAKCFLGLHTETCRIGNYGTSERLKYGVSERAVARTLWQARIGKTIGVLILVHSNTREAVTGYFLSRFARTTELGCLYELLGMSNTFAMINDVYGASDVTVSKTKRPRTAQEIAGLEASVRRLRRIRKFRRLDERGWEESVSPRRGPGGPGGNLNPVQQRTRANTLSSVWYGRSSSNGGSSRLSRWKSTTLAVRTESVGFERSTSGASTGSRSLRASRTLRLPASHGVQGSERPASASLRTCRRPSDPDLVQLETVTASAPQAASGGIEASQPTGSVQADSGWQRGFQVESEAVGRHGRLCGPQADHRQASDHSTWTAAGDSESGPPSQTLRLAMAEGDSPAAGSSGPGSFLPRAPLALLQVGKRASMSPKSGATNLNVKRPGRLRSEATVMPLPS